MKQNVNPAIVAAVIVIVLGIAIFAYMHNSGLQTNGKYTPPPSYESSSSGKPGGLIPMNGHAKPKAEATKPSN